MREVKIGQAGGGRALGREQGGPLGPRFFFLLRTALRDHQPPTTNRHQPPTATNRQPPTANGDQPPTANHC